MSLLKSGSANATATLEYLNQGNPKNASAESRASCFEGYRVASINLNHSIGQFKEKNIPEVAREVVVANGFISTCEEYQIEDATILSSYHYINDICQKVLKQIRNKLL
uniref:Pectinesterase inhibitor domain-containing protein n=1 Tax=Solanum lycopersicum TaxID=4081 RepID=A0A3Q7JB96_SOLLC